MNAATSLADTALDLEIYVYFRANSEQDQRVVDAFARQRRLVAQRHDLRLRGGRRVEASRKDYVTWLEVYRTPAAAGQSSATLAGSQYDTLIEPWLRAIARCAHDSGLTALAVEGRHHEVFILDAAD